MPRRIEKKRRLWLNVTQKGVKVSRTEFIKRLLSSISDGTYELPPEWKVTLHWRNTPNPRDMRHGPWTKEMRKSAKSSEGWDIAVATYLRRKL